MIKIPKQFEKSDAFAYGYWLATHQPKEDNRPESILGMSYRLQHYVKLLEAFNGLLSVGEKAPAEIARLKILHIIPRESPVVDLLTMRLRSYSLVDVRNKPGKNSKVVKEAHRKLNLAILYGESLSTLPFDIGYSANEEPQVEPEVAQEVVPEVKPEAKPEVESKAVTEAKPKAAHKRRVTTPVTKVKAKTVHVRPSNKQVVPQINSRTRVVDFVPRPDQRVEHETAIPWSSK